MIELRRTEERHNDLRRKGEVWLTFPSPERADPIAANGFRTLEAFDEIRLSPGGRVSCRQRCEAEVVTYVREGALACRDSTGRSYVLHAGEFQSMTTRRGLRHREANASCATHFFQIRLRPLAVELELPLEQKRFSVAQRRGSLCVVASPDARRGSLRIHQDALVCSALLAPGKHVIHELSPGRGAWLHLVQGEVLLGEVVLTTGDGAGVTDEPAVSLTAQEETEILLLDLGKT